METRDEMATPAATRFLPTRRPRAGLRVLPVILLTAAMLCVPAALAQCTIGLSDSSFPMGKGIEGGIEWQKQEAKVVAELDGKRYTLTGENGGVDVQQNVVFLIFNDAECSVPAANLEDKSASFGDAFGERLRRMKAAGIPIPRSKIVAEVDGESARIKGTLVVAANFFTENGQFVKVSTMKFLLASFADQQINRKVAPPPPASRKPATKKTTPAKKVNNR